MSQQIQITGGAKVRNLEGVLTGTSGVVNSLGINVPSGIPQLDGSGKILVSQLPNSVMEYKGTWNAATNTPTLADGTGNAGDVYVCNVAGTVNFGSGPITFYVGDQVLYSGTVWQKASGSSGSVTSVAVTESGDALTITGSPITTSGTINIGFAGTSGQYINGAGGLTTFPSLTGFVPYTGATANVNLGTFDLTADVITGATGSFASSGGSNTFDINHSSGSGIALNITKGGNGEGLVINKTSGSGNALSVTGSTSLGALSGTSATFSGDVAVDTNTLFVDSVNNRVGIGTSSPSEKLDVIGGAVAAGNGTIRTGITYSSLGLIGTFTNHDLGIITNGSERMRITSGGNVLIGTTTDSGQKLQVNGTSNFSGLLTNYNVYNTQTSSYTLVIGDASKIVEMNVGSANTVTIPTNASVAFPIGTEITVLQYGAGVTSIAVASGVTIVSKDNANIIANRYSGVTLIKRATNEWYLIGNIVV